MVKGLKEIHPSVLFCHFSIVSNPSAIMSIILCSLISSRSVKLNDIPLSILRHSIPSSQYNNSYTMIIITGILSCSPIYIMIQYVPEVSHEGRKGYKSNNVSTVAALK